jgi:proline iminopeptidase
MTPDKFTIQETFIDVGNGHKLYLQDWGNKNARVPILFLHGGPGSHTKDKHKSSFDPTKQRVVFFDQRGSGRSLPYGSLEHNTTEYMLRDIEKIRLHLKVNKFAITGGSWGACLALVYAIKYPAHVAGMVLNGIFTGTKAEIAWIEDGGFKDFFPDVWRTYLDATPQAHQRHPSRYHFNRILSNDQNACKQSAYAYENLEAALLALDDRYNPEDFDQYDPTGIRVEVYYLANKCFLPEGYILRNASKITAPVWLIQGRYDSVCPPVTAWKLSQKLLHSHLIWTISGHHASRESWNITKTLLTQWSE